MRNSKRLVLLFAFLLVGMFSTMIYANDTLTGTNVKEVAVLKDDKKIEFLESEDGHIRISKLAKINTFTFDSIMNVEGQAKQNTNITITVNQITADKENTITIVDSKIYELSKIGITESFNQLIELFEGTNQVVLVYSNTKDKQMDGEMSFIVIKEPEQTKENIKSTTIKPTIDIFK